MRRGAIEGWAVFVCRVVIGGVLIVAGAAKIGSPAQFAAQIAGFQLLPQAAIAPLALGLPFLEILTGGCLVAGVFTRAAAWIAVAMLAAFDAAIASAVVRGMSVSCGCFGPNDQTVTTWAEVARDAVFVVLALIAALRAPGALALDRRIATTP
ncbi:MAG TPA: MauE/DoxX family redox-associated membrane protein [Candidatus Elarobacter sp.]